MPRSRTFRFFTPLAVGVGTFLGLLAPSAHAARQDGGPPGSPLIDHAPVDCVVEQRYPLFHASVTTAEGLHTVKLYFHAQDYNDYYYVEMVDQGSGAYEASLPIPSPDTEAFVYYIEAVDLLFNTSRTEEYRTRVASAQDCDSEEGPPPIVVGSTTPGAAAIPPGFAASGIERFISSTGATTGIGGGGLGTVGIAAIGGGVAAGVTAGVLGGGGDDSAPTTPPPPTPGPPDGGPTPPPEPENPAPVACFHTTPDPPVVKVNDGIKFDASCSTPDKTLLMAQLADKIVSYHWKFGDGRPDKEGRVVNHAYVGGGAFFARLTVTDSFGKTGTTELQILVSGPTTPPPTGGGGGPGPGPGPPDADMSCSVNGPASGNLGVPFDFNVNVSKTGVLDAVNITLSCNCTGVVTRAQRGAFNNCSFNATNVTCTRAIASGNGSTDVVISVNPTSTGGNSCSCSVSSDTFDGNTSNNSGFDSVAISQRAPEPFTHRVDTSFTSRLDVPPGDGSVRGQVVLDGASLQETNNTAPFRHQVQGEKGRNTVEARVVVGNGEGRWVFDFTNAPHFVAGSFAVESGQVVVQEASRVVFRVSPSAPPIRFRYRLAD